MARRTPKRHTRYVYEEDEDEPRGPYMDARSLTLPSVAIISIVLASMTLTYYLVQERTRLDKRIDSVVGSVEKLASSIQRLADGLQYGIQDRWTIADHVLFCAQAEKLNRNFVCPSTADSKMSGTSSRLKSTFDGVSREIEEVGKRARDNQLERE